MALESPFQFLDPDGALIHYDHSVFRVTRADGTVWVQDLSRQQFGISRYRPFIPWADYEKGYMAKYEANWVGISWTLDTLWKIDDWTKMYERRENLYLPTQPSTINRIFEEWSQGVNIGSLPEAKRRAQYARLVERMRKEMLDIEKMVF
jgi:hypothetical protein